MTDRIRVPQDWLDSFNEGWHGRWDYRIDPAGVYEQIEDIYAANKHRPGREVAREIFERDRAADARIQMKSVDARKATSTVAESLRPFAFVLAVKDLMLATAYFCDVLGFEAQWQDRSDWQLVRRGAVGIMLGHCPDALPASAIGDHSSFAYLHVNDAQALHDEWARRGAIVLHPPVERAHGVREFAVATPDGHRLTVGEVVRPG
jgi:predicted enzyme related to lactoylglutathione lyase